MRLLQSLVFQIEHKYSVASVLAVSVAPKTPIGRKCVFCPSENWEMNHVSAIWLEIITSFSALRIVSCTFLFYNSRGVLERKKLQNVSSQCYMYAILKQARKYKCPLHSNFALFQAIKKLQNKSTQEGSLKFTGVVRRIQNGSKMMEGKEIFESVKHENCEVEKA